MGRVFFATNRVWERDAFGSVASAGDTLRLGIADVPAGATGYRMAGCSFTCDGDDDFRSPDGSCGAVMEEYVAAVREKGGVPLVSIHGFQYDFEDAVTRTDELSRWFDGGPYPLPNVPFLFTWPSTGSLDDYATDRGNAKAAGPAIARVLDELAAHGPLEGAVLLVHSSGAWALEHAVRAATAGAGVPRRLFRDAVLCAADVAADSLDAGGGLHALAEMADRVWVVVYRGDTVLGTISKLWKQNGPRLGSDGPPLDRPLPENVRVVDVSYIVSLNDPGSVTGREADPNLFGHQYYRRDEGVREVLAGLLADVPPKGWRKGVRNQPFAIKEREADFYWYAGAPMVQPRLDPMVNPGS